MYTAILVVWWIGLLGALVATLVILKQVAVLLRTLHHIHELAEHTRVAAAHLAGHVGSTPSLAELPGHAARLREAARGLGPLAEWLALRNPGLQRR
jgi:hypothetical protein